MIPETVSSPTTGPTSIRPVTLHHLALKTIRMQAMIDWYCQVLGCEVRFQSPLVSLLSYDSANHRIALVGSESYADGGDQRNRVGVHHAGFELQSIDDLLQTWQRLSASGTLPYMSLDHHVTLSFYYRDPDENTMELVADWYRTAEESADFLSTSPEFKTHPYGMPVDPAKLVAARAAGKLPDELHRMSYTGEVAPDIAPDLGV